MAGKALRRTANATARVKKRRFVNHYQIVRAFQKQGDYRKMSNLSVCRLSFQYVNLHLIYFIYLFQPRPSRNSSQYCFFLHAFNTTRGLSAGIAANGSSLLVLTLIVGSLLVSKHRPWAPAVCRIPLHNWWRGSLQFSSCGFRTSQTKNLQIANMSHYKTSSRCRLFKIMYYSQIWVWQMNQGKIRLKSCSLNQPQLPSIQTSGFNPNKVTRICWVCLLF